MGKNKGWFRRRKKLESSEEMKDKEKGEGAKEESAKKKKPEMNLEGVADDTVYRFDFDLDELIATSIKDLCDPDKDDDSLKFKHTLNGLSNQLKTVESRQKQVTKILDDCSDKLQQYYEDLQEQDKEEELREAAAEAEAKDAAEANAKNEETDSGSDDDVQFISTSFDPDIAAKNKVIIEQNPNLSQTLSGAQSGGTPRTIIYKVPSIQTTTAQSPASTTPNQELPKSKLENLRAALAATINKQVQGAAQGITAKQTQGGAQGFSPKQNQGGAQGFSPKQVQGGAQGFTSLSNLVPQSAANVITVHQGEQNNPNVSQQAAKFGKYGNLTLPQTVQAYYNYIEALSVGSKVYGKKLNEVWYRGTIEAIQNRLMAVNERKFTIKYDSKGRRTLTAREIAFRDHINIPVAVGTRIIALYRDEESTASFYAGIIAETPNGRNQFRYLVFFDDGYAQYSSREEIFKVVDQSINVWEDVHQDSQEFIKEYLKQYPERPMVRLHKNQLVKTEWNGKWWTARVKEVDASLVKMFFLADKREELIYRGSTRLEPLYSALANQEQNKISGKVKRHNLDSSKQKPVVEYTRGQSNEEKSEGRTHPPQGQDEPKKRAVARKSTVGGARSSSTSDDSGNWQGPWMKHQQQRKKPATKPESSLYKGNDFIASSISSNKAGKDMASLLQERLSKTADTADIVEEESMGERIESCVPLQDRNLTLMKPHSCCATCLKDIEDDPLKFLGTNPLLIPLLCGWERHVCKIKPGGRRMVAYRAPCGRRLRNMQELDKYLMLTGCNLTVDLFCYDSVLHVHTEFVPVKTFCDIKDLSYGKELVPIQCVNGIDRLYPDYVEYSNVRLPAKGVNLNLDPEFMVCCDCTDNCRDKSKCACQQLTVEATSCSSAGKVNPNAGLEYRRLKEPLITGVYECNSNCACDKRCLNRVVQNGLQVRLQVFKTEQKGWGLRCLDDLAKGNFICIYAGQLLTEQGANEDGQQFGDEYLAELDYIEVVERQKEGYESDVDMDEGLGEGSEEEEEIDDSEEEGANLSHNESDSDFSGDEGGAETGPPGSTLATRRSTRTRKNMTGKQLGKLVLRRDSSKSGVKEEEWTVKSGSEKPNSHDSPIMIEDDDDEEPKSSSQSSLKKSVSADSMGDSDSLPDLDADPVTEEKPVIKETKTSRMNLQENMKRSSATEEVTSMEGIITEGNKKFARRSTTTNKASRFKNLPDPKKKLGTIRLENVDQEEEEEEDSPVSCTRTFFQDGQDCYIMDAKSCGNIGRYLNHSCTPNVFVQNVFVDTHDLRFPWVTFWAGQYIRAGTELTWDYNYEVGSVPGKVLYCYCGSPECRGRLL